MIIELKNELKNYGFLILKKFDKKSWGFSKKLNPSANINDIEKIESQMNFKLPDELKKLYLLNNGEGEFSIGTFYGLGFMLVSILSDR